MPLFKILDTGACYEVAKIPYEKDFTKHKKALTSQEILAAEEYLLSQIGSLDKFTVAQIANGIWAKNHPPLEPIYNMVCRVYPRAHADIQEDIAAGFVGLLVLQLLMSSCARWGCTKVDLQKRGRETNFYWRT